MRATLSFLMGLFCAGTLCAERLCGAERMERVDRLPELLEGTRAMQVSSRDRLGGNDGDGYFGTHPCLYTEADGGKVLFDERKPGCLYRVWMTFTTTSMLTNRVKFYFDGESEPRIDLTVEGLFSGTNSLFLTPLVGNAEASCKGYYCYVPFEYEESLKVTLDWVPTGTNTQASPFYYNMTYHQFDSASGVQTWDESESVAPIVSMLSLPGVDPKPTNENFRVSATTNVVSGGTVGLLNRTGAGAVQSIKLDPSPASVSVLQNCRLLMNWDGGLPEVDVPLGSFFGSGTNEIEVSSLPLGMTTNGDYYCFFPMPFWESAEICISNGSGDSVTIPFEIQYTTNAYDSLRCGHFYAVYTHQLIGDDGRDVSFITTQGRGHFVGLSLYVLALDFGRNNLDHLEGDERIYFDGSRSPGIYGTGAEDYFNCAWYFKNAPCLLPYHGCALQQFNSTPPNATQAYRFHLTDVLPFYSEFKFGMEHGRENDTSGLYSSVAYFYKQEQDGWTQTAAFDVTNGASVLYQAIGASSVSNAWCFEGTNDQEIVSASGVSFSGASQFQVPIETNAGVILKRLTDRGVGRQKASVYVDGEFAGTWYDADCNFLKARLYNLKTYLDVKQRWNEAEFLIPLELTAGKSQVNLQIQRDADGTNFWNEYRYEVYCLKPLDQPDDVDKDGLPDEWEALYFNNVGAAIPSEDVDEDGLDTGEEYIASTSPIDAGSVFALTQTDHRFEFFAASNRTYHVWFCTNLSETVWLSVTNFLGSGTVHAIEPADTFPSFYRAEVQRNE